jgi:hypothetical protein
MPAAAWPGVLCSATLAGKTIIASMSMRIRTNAKEYDLKVERVAAERPGSIARTKEAAKVRWHTLTRSAAGVASFYRHKSVHEVESADAGVGVARAMDNATGGRSFPSGSCSQLHFAVNVTREPHGRRKASKSERS